jgi:hypothetical protein
MGEQVVVHTVNCGCLPGCKPGGCCQWIGCCQAPPIETPTIPPRKDDHG